MPWIIQATSCKRGLTVYFKFYHSHACALPFTGQRTQSLSASILNMNWTGSSKTAHLPLKHGRRLIRFHGAKGSISFLTVYQSAIPGKRLPSLASDNECCNLCLSRWRLTPSSKYQRVISLQWMLSDKVKAQTRPWITQRPIRTTRPSFWMAFLR